MNYHQSDCRQMNRSCEKVVVSGVSKKYPGDVHGVIADDIFGVVILLYWDRSEPKEGRNVSQYDKLIRLVFSGIHNLAESESRP